MYDISPSSGTRPHSGGSSRHLVVIVYVHGVYKVMARVICVLGLHLVQFRVRTKNRKRKFNVGMSDVEGHVKQRYYCSSQGVADTQVRSRPIHKALYSNAGWKPLRGRKADPDVLTGCFYPKCY